MKDAVQLQLDRLSETVSDLLIEMWRMVIQAAPDEAIEHKAVNTGDSAANGWLYNLVNERSDPLGETLWQMVIEELDRRDQNRLTSR